MHLDPRQLSVRLIGSFVGVIVLTTLLIVFPALRLVNHELNRQLDARMQQGRGSTEALYAARLRELQALATLSAERPTLLRLLQARDLEALDPYLETIRAAAQLDGLMVTDGAGRLVSQAVGSALPGDLLAGMAPPGAPEVAAPTLLGGRPVLLALAPITVEGRERVGSVVAVILLDERFLGQLNRETGLHHTLYVGSSRTATTLQGFAGRLSPESQGLHTVGSLPYQMEPLALTATETPLVDLLALPAQEILATRQRVVQVLAGNTILVALVAALLATLLARRLTAPLQHLVQASERVGRGDLDSPVPTEADIAEVAVLAHTLEQMRLRLRAAYRELHRAKSWYETLIASLSEGVVTVDTGGRFTSFSAGAERLLGWRATDVIGRPASAVLVGPNGEKTALGALPHPAPATATRQTVLTARGDAVTLRITSGVVTAQEDGAREQAYLLHDVTAEERGMRLREFLLANLSHEFKTPLAALHAAVELLATELPSLSQEELRELVNTVLQGTLRLEELVDNLLSSASLHTGHFAIRPRPTDLETVIEETLLAMRPLLTLSGHYLRVEAPSPLRPVLADARRLSQVLVNLISNASKYSPAGEIIVRVNEQPEAVQIEVIDRGPGVPAEMQPHLFQPFSRPTDQGQRGVGLGLSIVKAIVEHHGGTVGLQSSVGGGAAFGFTLPYWKPPKTDEATE